MQLPQSGSSALRNKPLSRRKAPPAPLVGEPLAGRLWPC
nr:MAG TPA: hypothetical protein [Caudoviricetes sp.]